MYGVIPSWCPLSDLVNSVDVPEKKNLKSIPNFCLPYFRPIVHFQFLFLTFRRVIHSHKYLVVSTNNNFKNEEQFICH